MAKNGLLNFLDQTNKIIGWIKGNITVLCCIVYCNYTQSQQKSCKRFSFMHF